MPKNLLMDRKNIYRREESQRVRMERIIAGYVKYRHSNIYDEAKAFYHHLDELYPGKKDLRRSNEYEWLKNGSHETMKKYYPRKTTNPRKAKITDNMVLQIPLMEITTLSDENLPYTNEITVETSSQSETMVEASSQSETTVETSSQSETMVEASSQSETTVEASSLSTLPPISDELFEQIIQDLCEDPDISNFFNNVDFEIDDCPLW